MTRPEHERGVREAQHEPSLRDRLHPAPDVGKEESDPVAPEAHVFERGEHPAPGPRDAARGRNAERRAGGLDQRRMRLGGTAGVWIGHAGARVPCPRHSSSHDRKEKNDQVDRGAGQDRVGMPRPLRKEATGSGHGASRHHRRDGTSRRRREGLAEESRQDRKDQARGEDRVAELQGLEDVPVHRERHEETERAVDGGEEPRREKRQAGAA